MRLAINDHALPAVGDDLDMRFVDVGVLFDEVVTEDGGEEFGRSDRVLFREDIDGVFLGVGGHDYGVVAAGVGGFDIAFKEDGDGGFGDGMDTSGGVAVDFVKADVVLEEE